MFAYSTLWLRRARGTPAAFIATLASVAVFLTILSTPPARASSGHMVLTSSTTLTEDHYGEILIRANDVRLDCAGHHIFGPGFAGVDLHFVTGTTIKNCNVSGFKVGFFLRSSPNNTLAGNSASDNESEGFAIASSVNNVANVLTRNTSSHNGSWGFAVYNNSTDTTLGENTSTGNGFAGFFIGLGSNRTHVLQNTSQHDNYGGFDVDSDDNLVEGNTVLDTPGNGFLIFQANDNVFTGNRAERCNGDGFTTTGSEHGNVYGDNVALSNGNDGFHFDNGTSGHQLAGNVASGNAVHGFGFYSVSNIISTHNEATGNGAFGFSLFRTTASTSRHDVSYDNQNGFVAGQSYGNTFTHDVANHNHDFGFVLYDGSTGNTVEQSVAHQNTAADAADDASAGLNSWIRNSFGTTFLP